MFADRKPTAQSSTRDGKASSLAVDGNLNPNYASCSHTYGQTDPWWRVDLLDPVQVVYLFIVNRWDCCTDRLHNFEIRIGNSLGNNGNSNPQCGGLHSLKNIESKVIPCTSPLIGRYVNIIIPGPNKTLTLCEVQVHGVAGKVTLWETNIFLVEDLIYCLVICMSCKNCLLCSFTAKSMDFLYFRAASKNRIIIFWYLKKTFHQQLLLGSIY